MKKFAFVLALFAVSPAFATDFTVTITDPALLSALSAQRLIYNQRLPADVNGAAPTPAATDGAYVQAIVERSLKGAIAQQAWTAARAKRFSAIEASRAAAVAQAKAAAPAAATVQPAGAK